MVQYRGMVRGGILSAMLLLAAAVQADEAAAVMAIEKLGGWVTRDAKRPSKPVVSVSLTNPFLVTDAGLKELKELKDLQELNLDNTKVTDAGLKELKELKSLQTLHLCSTKVTERGVVDLRTALPRLTIRR